MSSTERFSPISGLEDTIGKDEQRFLCQSDWTHPFKMLRPALIGGVLCFIFQMKLLYKYFTGYCVNQIQ